MYLIYSLLMLVWGLALFVSCWFVIAGVVALVDNCKGVKYQWGWKLVSCLFLIPVLIISSPFWAEGIGQYKYLFTKDGTYVGTITPRLMLQTSYNRLIKEKVVVGEYGLQSQPNGIYLTLTNGVYAEIGVELTVHGRSETNLISVASRAIKSGITDPNIMVKKLFERSADNILTSIREKIGPVTVENFRDEDRLITKAKITTILLQDLKPAMDQFGIYARICDIRVGSN